MDFIQRLIHYFAVVRRQVRRHRQLVVTCAAVVVFATTYALILPAITLDENTANDQPGIELATASDDAEQEAAAANEAEPTAESAAEPEAQAQSEQEPAAANEAQGSATQDSASTEAPATTSDAAVATTEQPAASAADSGEALITSHTTLEAAKESDSADYKVTAEVDAYAKLPEGVTLRTQEITRDSDAAAYQKYYDAALAKLQEGDPDATELANARFFDISFVDESGNEVEPSDDVKVSLTYDNPVQVQSKVQVVHFDDDTAEATVLDDDKTTADPDADGKVGEVSFESDKFSVYAITETTTVPSGETREYRRTYTFQNDDGSAYTFNLNPNPTGGSNTTTSQQIVKQGESLQSVGTPEAKKSESQGQEFQGWKVISISGDVTDLQVNQVIQLPYTSTATIGQNQNVTLQATFDSAVVLTFYDSDNTTVIYKEKVAKGSVVNLDGFHATAEVEDTSDSGNQVTKTFVGWNNTQGATDAMAGSSSYTANADETFYPVYKEGHWLYFDANDAGSDIKATFTDSIFVGATEDTVQPTKNPQRQGYTFGGWYTDADCTQAFTWGSTLSANTTLYAKWTPSDTTYTVVIWRQRVTDDKNATDAERTYDYGESVTVDATTGEQVNGSTSALSTYEGYTTGNYQGFHFANAGVSRTDSTTSVTVVGDGSTVINVYYDRDLITMNFSTSEDTTSYRYTETTAGYRGGTTQYGLVNGEYVQLSYSRNGNDRTGQPSGWSYDDGYYDYNWHSYTGTRYTRETVTTYWKTFTGLYGQPLSKYNYSWPADNGPWRFRATDGNQGYMGMTFLGQFVLPGDQNSQYDGQSNTVITFHNNGQVGTYYYFYLQNADGTWPASATYTGSSASGGSFYFSEKFDNFSVTSYRFNAGSNGGNTGSWTNIGVGDGVDMDNRTSLGVRYARKSYNVEFYNGSTHLDADQSKLYEASLSGLSTPDASGLTYPGNEALRGYYEFVGWFADPECTTYVSFGSNLSETEKADLQAKYPSITSFVTYETMPGHNLPVYAGWKARTCTVTFEPNGGTIPGQAANESLQETVFLNAVVSNSTQSTVQRATRTTDGVTYTLVGWYKRTNKDPSTDTLYNFGDKVTEDITLVAHWRQSGQFYVRYVDSATEGNASNEAVDDTIAYADQSEVRVQGYPSTWAAPNGKVFAGWQLTTTATNADGTTTTTTHTYTPGQTFTMDADQTTEISDKKYMTLTALYTQLGTTFLTYNANGGSGTLTGLSNNSQVNIPMNQTTTLSNGTGFSREGYVLAGWNSNKEAATAGTIEWNLGDQVGVNGDSGNTLYAVWHKLVQVKKVDNSKTTTALSGARFKLSKGTTTTGEDGSSTTTYSNVTASDFYGTVNVGTDGFTTSPTGSNGLAALNALKDGSYRLEETQAPDGYIISTADYDFTVANGKVTSVTGNGATVNTDGDTITITNTPGTPLPNTGGSGSLPFLLGGSALITTAIVGFALRRRNEGRGV